MQRRGIPVVKIFKISYGLESVRTERIFYPTAFFFDFFAQHAEKTPHVNSVGPPCEPVGTGRQMTRNGKNNGATKIPLNA